MNGVNLSIHIFLNSINELLYIFNSQEMTRNYEYVKTISGEHIYQLDEYGGHKFNRYWFDFDTQTLYLLTRGRYKIIKPSEKNGFLLLSLTDVNDKIHSVSYNKFIKEFNEMVDKEKIK